MAQPFIRRHGVNAYIYTCIFFGGDHQNAGIAIIETIKSECLNRLCPYLLQCNDMYMYVLLLAEKANNLGINQLEKLEAAKAA